MWLLYCGSKDKIIVSYSGETHKMASMVMMIAMISKLDRLHDQW